MSKLKNFYDIVSQNITEEEINTGVADIIVGNESADLIVREESKDALATMQQNIDLSITEAMADDKEFKIEPHQIKMAVEAAGLAVAPVSALKKIATSPVSTPVTIGSESMNMEIPSYADMDIVSSGFEAFDGQTLKPSVKFAVVYTALSTKQDAGAELLFPIVPFDSKSSGAIVTATITSIMQDFTRSVDGLPNKDQLQLTPLIKVGNVPEKIDVDRNRLVPVLRDENETLFVKDLAHQVNYNGENVKTAPLVIGKEVNLLGLGQTDAMLAKGLMNMTDALDANVVVTSLWYEITGKQYELDINALGAGFTYSTTGQNKDIILNLNTDGLGVKSDDIDGLPAGYTVKFDLKLNGDGNTQTGDVALYANRFEVSEVLDNAGNVLPVDDADYIAITDALKDMKVIGWEQEAYLTNTNTRVRGIITTSNSYTSVYTIPFRTGFTTVTPIVDNGTDGDLHGLSSAISTSRMKLNAAAYKTLTNFIAYMRNSGPDAVVKGLSQYFVSKYFSEESVDLNTIVDSLTSTNREADIRNSLVLKIKEEAIRALVNSNYGYAFDAVTNGGKPTVIIVTDPVIGSFISKDDAFQSDASCNYKIATTVNPSMRGKIVFTFGTFGGNRNSVSDPLNFGQCFMAPDLIIPVIKTVNGATATERTTMQRFLHVINLPILCVYNVSGLDTVIGKVTVNVSK